MNRESFNLEVKDGTLMLSGERKFEDPATGVERVAGKFTRAFVPPQSIKRDEIRATYRDGILEIQVPKAEEAKTKQTMLA